MRIVALYLFLGAVLFAQTSTLHGVITDTSGAAVASAKITLSAPKGPPHVEISDGQGTYTFSGLVPGAYTLEASASQLILLPLKLSLTSGTNTRDLQLNITTVVERITVEQDTEVLGTDASTNASATVIKGEALAALSDNPEDLVADLQALAGPSAGPGGGTIYVDGFSGGVLPPKETIREVRINQNPFSPEYDKLGLGRIEILTKPGAEKWHGTLTYNYATSAWNTRNPYSAAKAPLLLNEWENVLGGRLTKRSSLSLDVNQNNVDNGAIVNAVTLDPKSLTPVPFFDFFKTIQRRTNLYPRVDYQLNERNTLSVRYAFTHGNINGAGINGFNLTSRGEDRKYTIQTVQVVETAVLGAGAMNETRFQFYRNDFQTVPNSATPAIQVLGAFNGGGTPVGNSRNTQQDLEFHNITTIAHGSHTVRFGIRARVGKISDIAPQNFNGTFTFNGGLAPVLDANNTSVLDASGQPQLAAILGIERYRRTLLFQQLGYSPAQIRAAGGGAAQFTIASGTPGVSGMQTDAGPFIGDDWRFRPNLTLNLGLRYEAQTNIRNPNGWAPRIGLAWAPGGSANKTPKTVIRAGFGIFYDRFALNNTLNARRYDGVVQQQFVIANPDFYPVIPLTSSLSKVSQITRQVDSNLRAPSILQTAITVERTLPHGTAMAVTYTRTQGVHSLRSLDINAPSPGSGVYPLGNPNPVFLMTSSGVYHQNQLTWNVTSKVNKTVSLTGSYTLNRARSNTDGLGTFPANPYNYAGEYGPAATDVRHQVSVSGTINTKWSIRLSPLVSAQSGPPFDITTGSDLYGTTLFNGRPGIATNPSKAGVIATPYGLLDPNPTPGQALLGRNYGRGPGQVLVNLRVAKIIPFGPEQAGGGGAHRYNASISMSMRNLINHTNPGPIIGNLTSPLFGRANQTAGSVNGEGFSENASNRRLEMQLRITF